jgi:hypothetical protein
MVVPELTNNQGLWTSFDILGWLYRSKMFVQTETIADVIEARRQRRRRSKGSQTDEGGEGGF